MRIAGVDCGTKKVAIAILEDGQLTPHVLHAAGDQAGALRDIGQFAAAYLNDCDLVYVEAPLVGRSVKYSLQVAQATGAVTSHLSVPSYFVNVSTWKKAVTGNGNSPKGLVRDSLMELQPGYSTVCGGDQDLIDATCVALYGEQQQRVVAALRADY